MEPISEAVQKQQRNSGAVHLNRYLDVMEGEHPIEVSRLAEAKLEYLYEQEIITNIMSPTKWFGMCSVVYILE